MEDRDKIDGILWTFQRYYNNPHLFVYFSRQGKDQIEGWDLFVDERHAQPNLDFQRD